MKRIVRELSILHWKYVEFSLRFLRDFYARLQASTLVVGEHEEGVLKASTLSAVAAASALGDVSVLVGGFGPSVHKAATQAASAHSAISQVLWT